MSLWKDKTKPLVNPLVVFGSLPLLREVHLHPCTIPLLSSTHGQAWGCFSTTFFPTQLEKSRGCSSSCHSPQPKPLLKRPSHCSADSPAGQKCLATGKNLSCKAFSLHWERHLPCAVVASECPFPTRAHQKRSEKPDSFLLGFAGPQHF